MTRFQRGDIELLYTIEQLACRYYEEQTCISIKPFHCGQLIDTVGALQFCNFFNDEKLPPIAVIHVLSKALPQRCQYRNLKEVCISYCKKDVDFETWLRMLALCSLGGYYPHVDKCISLTSRMALYAGIYETSSSDWQAWLHRNGYLLYYILKEYIVFVCKFDVALHEVVATTYRWDMFASICVNAMNSARSIYSQADNYATAFEHIETELLKANTLQLKYLYKIPKRRFYHWFNQALVYARQRKYEQWLNSNIDIRARLRCTPTEEDMVYHIILHQAKLPHVTHQQWFEVLGVSNTTVWSTIYRAFHAQNSSLRMMIAALMTLNDRDFALYNEYGCRLFDLKSIALIPMPGHWYRQHHRSLQHKHNDGIYYICKACKTFKAFLVKKQLNDVNFFATGHDKVLFDDETNRMFCARRSIKNTYSKKRKRSHELHRRNAHVVHNQQARLLRRKDEHEECKDSELVPVQMCGKILQCYDKMYTLCMQPGCARPCVYEFKKTKGVFSCGRCTYNRANRVCGYCGSKVSADAAMVQMKHKGKMVTILLCPRHAVPQLIHFHDVRNKAVVWKMIKQHMRKRYG